MEQITTLWFDRVIVRGVAWLFCLGLFINNIANSNYNMIKPQSSYLLQFELIFGNKTAKYKLKLEQITTVWFDRVIVRGVAWLFCLGLFINNIANSLVLMAEQSRAVV